MKRLAIAGLAFSCALCACADAQVLWKSGDASVAVYRIPAICTAPDGKTVVAVCDARKNHGGDLNSSQPIWITCRTSTDNGKTWSAPRSTWDWKWDENEQWAASDPSFIVDEVEKKIFLFYNVWECKKDGGRYQHWVQESTDNGLTWSKPRDITADIHRPEWPERGFLFITSGTGIQTKDGTLLHTIVWVHKHVALFGSKDHGKTWQPIGNPASPGDECKVIELADGRWMINSRWRGGGREIHISSDKGMTWTSHEDTKLIDPACNGQIMRYPIAAARPGKQLKPGAPESVLLFSNCKSPNRRINVTVRTSWDEGETWTEGVTVEPAGSAYSDITVLPNGDVGILYEGAGYGKILFDTVSPDDFLRR